MPHLLVAAHHQDFVWLFGHVADACELDCPLVEIFVLVAHTRLPLQLQVIEVGASAHVAACKAVVIFEPVDAAHLVHVTFADHVLWALSCVKIEDMNSSKPHRASEHMASMREFYFMALFQYERSLLCNRVRKYIHH